MNSSESLFVVSWMRMVPARNSSLIFPLSRPARQKAVPNGVGGLREHGGVDGVLGLPVGWIMLVEWDEIANLIMIKCPEQQRAEAKSDCV